MESLAKQITQIGKFMFERRLTDIAGGNISARKEEKIFITPTGAGQQWRWNLSEDDILCADLHTNELMDNPRHSKESISHLMVYRAYPEVNAIIHAHPFHTLPFLASLTPIRPQTLPAELYGEIGFIDDAPLYSEEQARLIVKELSNKQELMNRLAAAILMPKHGIFIAGKNLNTVIDCLERIDNSAWCNLSVKLLV
jgi:L-fuculose-phosphate aldolase